MDSFQPFLRRIFTEVLEPESLRQEIETEIAKMLRRYKPTSPLPLGEG